MRLEVGLSTHAYQRLHIVHGFFQIIDTRPIDSLSTDEQASPCRLSVKHDELVVASRQIQ